jgi:hypothetical protein
VQVLARYRDGKRGPHHLRAHPAPGSSRIRSADFWLGDSHDLSPRIRGARPPPGGGEGPAHTATATAKLRNVELVDARRVPRVEAEHAAEGHGVGRVPALGHSYKQDPSTLHIDRAHADAGDARVDAVKQHLLPAQPLLVGVEVLRHDRAGDAVVVLVDPVDEITAARVCER